LLALGMNLLLHGRNVLALALMSLQLVLGTGCRQAAREVGQAAAPPAVDKTLQTLADPQNQPLLEDVATAPGIERLGENIGQGLGRGIMDETLASFFVSTDADPQRADRPPERTAFGRSDDQPSAKRSATRPTTAASTANLPPASEIARELTRGVALGVHDATNEVGLTTPNLQKLLWIVIVLLAVAGLITLALLIALTVLALAISRVKPAVATSGSKQPDVNP
jgi:hypothetical protein